MLNSAPMKTLLVVALLLIGVRQSFAEDLPKATFHVTSVRSGDATDYCTGEVFCYQVHS